MTAQVAVLSTHGVAVASDSSVTVLDRDRGNRSYPSADKIFSVPGAPVAVLHSGAAALRGVPWELLIERWGQERDQVELGSMAAYADDLLQWLVRQDHFADPEGQDATLRWMYRDYLLSMRAEIREVLAPVVEAIEPGVVSGLDAELVDIIVQRYLDRLASRDDVSGLTAETAAGLVERMSEELQADFDWVFDDTPRTELLDSRLHDIARLLVLKAEPFSIDATIALVGYGSTALFPSSWQGTVSAVLGGCVRVTEVDETQIGLDVRVSINPYGLTDAIHMFLRGTSKAYTTVAHEALETLAESWGSPPEEEAAREVLDAAHEDLDQRLDALEWSDFVKPMLDVAETLPLAELVRFADSLVGLASLRQLINGDASVGGPVDVAQVTRNGGFEWVRRKSGP